MEEDQKKLLEEVTNNEKIFFNFEENVRVRVGFTKWILGRKMVPDFNDKEKQVERIEFYSKVLIKEDDKIVEKEFTTLSSRFMKQIAPFILDKNPEEDVVYLSVKRLGTGTSTNYDMEAI